MYRHFALLILLSLAVPAAADRCRAFVNGSEIVVDEQNFPTFADEVKRRENLLGWPARQWNRAWGSPAACNSGVLFDYLATTVPENDIKPYCLSETVDGFVLVPGERNFRGLCRKTVCDRVNATADETVALSKSIARSAAETVTRPDTAVAIAHKSGALILSGSASALAADIGATGSTLVTALSAPTAAAAVGLTVLTVGGAVYLCR